MKAFPLTFPIFTCIIIILVISFSSCRKHDSSNTLSVSSTEKPNIILILADDIGYEVPRYTGGQSYSTPSIDNLARSGIQLSQGYVCPNCSPTRIELLTGKYGFRNYTLWGRMNTGQKTIANMLHDAGYKTCVAGKWQFDGGDLAIHGFGFDKYLLFLPFYIGSEEEENKHRYKDPHLYEQGNFLADSITHNKYADDMFADYISNFIDSNQANPFFIYFPLSLCHQPFFPTPDDAAYATWNPDKDEGDTSFFKSMVKYMDKKIQQVVDKINNAGLSKNTIIIFLGDNGTPYQIHSLYKNQEIKGGKEATNIYGTHVPLIVNWPGHIAAQQSSAGLVDASDFLPAIASLANIKTPSDYGTLDGINFAPLLFGSQQRLRDWSYCYWNPQGDYSKFKVWVQDENYKLYDSTKGNHFYNISADPLELNPIPADQLTQTEVIRKKTFDSVLNVMHN